MKRLFWGARILRKHLVAVQLLLLGIPFLLRVRQLDVVLESQLLEVLDEGGIERLVVSRLNLVVGILPPRKEKELEVHHRQLHPLLHHLLGLLTQVIEMPRPSFRRALNRDHAALLHGVDRTSHNLVCLNRMMRTGIAELGNMQVLHRASTGAGTHEDAGAVRKS